MIDHASDRSQDRAPRVRAYQSSDLDAVKDLIHSTIDSCYRSAYSPEAVAFFKDYHSRDAIAQRGEQGYAVVVEQDGRIVGTGTLIGDHITAVFVSDSIQRQTLGTQIMTHLENRARSSRIEAVTLDASLPSKPFYDSLGYSTIEEASLAVADGKTLRFYRMRKSLDRGLEDIYPWGRSFDEYRRMFDLTDDDLCLRIVGCADGPASFNVEMKRRGHRAISVDPLYQSSAEAIDWRIKQVFDRMISEAREKAHAFVWHHIRSPEHLGQIRITAMNEFLRDYPRGLKEGRYIPALLPTLPFRDRTFDLALCSHYLFTYSDAISRVEHLRSILEMLRVAAEVRIFPLVGTFDRGRSPHVDALVERLRGMGFAVRIRRVPYEFQRGGNEMLHIMRA